MKSRSKKTITFVMSYHNNIYDSLIALKPTADVKVLSPRPLRKAVYLTDGISITTQPQWRIGNLHLWKIRPLWKNQANSTHIIVKNILIRNLIPVIFATTRRARVIMLIQFVPRIPKFYTPLLRILLTSLRQFTQIAFIALTLEGQRSLATLGQNSTYIPACINPARFIPATPGKSNKTLSILVVSKYQNRKNLDILVRAIAQLRQKYPAISFKTTIIGGTTTQNRYNEIANLVSQLSMTNVFTLLTEVPHTEMPQHYAQADLFIFPASHEPLGYALLEAMAAGLPVAISNEVGAKSYIQKDKNGYIYTAKDVPALISSIERFIINNQVNTTKLQMFGKSSLTIVKKQHTPEKWLKQIAVLL